MVVGDDIAVLAVDDAAACTLRHILTQPAVGGNGFRFDCDDGVFIFSDNLFNRELAACSLRQIVVRGVHRFIYRGAAKIADRQRVSPGTDCGG